jgi:hypothetical protein
MADYSYFSGRKSTLESIGDHTKKRDPYEYRVSYKEGDGGVYQSLLRFIPIPEGIASTNLDYLFKYVTWLVNPSTGEKRCVDNPSTVGETKNPMDNLMWALLTSKNEQQKSIARENMRRTEQYVALVQIINDPKHPEYNNRIMYMRFGTSLHDKIVQELQPNQSIGVTYPSPFDVFHGRLFNLIVTSKNSQNDYTQSRFLDIPNIPQGLRYKNDRGEYVIATDGASNTEKALMHQYILSQIANIDLAKHAYKEWDESTTQFVNAALDVISKYAQTGILPKSDTFATSEAQTVNPSSFIPQGPAPTIPQSPTQQPINYQQPSVATTQVEHQVDVNNLPIPPTAAPQITTEIEQPQIQKTTGSRFGDLENVIF